MLSLSFKTNEQFTSLNAYATKRLLQTSPLGLKLEFVLFCLSGSLVRLCKGLLLIFMI